MAGEKQYELTDHLGNVRAAITDRKLAKTDGASGYVYDVDITSSNDYYPFGMPMPERWKNYLPEEISEWTEINETTHTEWIEMSSESPGNNGNFGFTNSTVNNYWYGRGHSSVSASLSQLHSSTAYPNGSNDSPELWGGGNELVFHFGSADGNQKAGMFRKIIRYNGTGNTSETQALEFDLDEEGDDKIVLDFYVGLNWSTEFPDEEGTAYILDNAFNPIAQQDFVISGGYPSMAHITLEAEQLGKNGNNLGNQTGSGSGYTAPSNPDGIYYLAITFDVKSGNTTNNTPIMTYVKQWNMTIYDEDEFQEQEVSSNTFENQGVYRFGFNGMERDDELKGKGNSYSTYFRIYDPRLALWFSVDPETRHFTSHSPYNSNLGNPIFYSDPRGDCPTGDCNDFETPSGERITIDKNAQVQLNDQNQLVGFVTSGEKLQSYGWNSESKVFVSDIDKSIYNPGNALNGFVDNISNKAVGVWEFVSDSQKRSEYIDETIQGLHNLDAMLEGGNRSGARMRGMTLDRIKQIPSFSSYQYGSMGADATFLAADLIIGSKVGGLIREGVHIGLYGPRIGRVYYSVGSRTDFKRIYGIASNHAARNGGHVINSTPVGRFISRMDNINETYFDNHYRRTIDNFWDEASYWYAKGSRGPSVDAILNKNGINPFGTFNTVELPQLNQSGIRVNKFYH